MSETREQMAARLKEAITVLDEPYHRAAVAQCMATCAAALHGKRKMPNANYQKGRRFEWAICKHYRELGYDASRTAGSHGKFDVIATRAGGDIILAQCKVVSDETTERRIRTNFLANPPYPPYSLPAGVHQVILIKVEGSSNWSQGAV